MVREHPADPWPPAATAATAGTGADPVDRALLRFLAETGASAGCVYELAPEEQLLYLTLVSGIPVSFVAPWQRVALTSQLPVADALRRRRLVSSSNHADLVRDYPRIAVATPYPFSTASVPLEEGGRCHGAAMLMWPVREAPMPDAEREHITRAARRLSAVLRTRAGPAGSPRRVPLPRRVVPPAQGAAAVDYLERLPGGALSLDLDGRTALVTQGAAELLATPAELLLGRPPWEVVPWLDDPVFEDRYRGAVISRALTSFTACRPPDTWLSFRLVPDGRGVSVWLTPADADPAGLAAIPGEPTPIRAGQMYQMLHLSAALTETVGLRDVLNLISDELAPSFGAQGVVVYLAENGRLHNIEHRGYSAEAIEHFEGMALDDPRSPAAHTLSTGRAAFYASPQEVEVDYPGLDVPRRTGKSAWAILPLIISGGPVGVCVLSYLHPREFSPDERRVLTSLAGILAQAIDRARLYDTKQALAHHLQQVLLPHSLPPVDGLRVAGRYLPSTRGMEIGGDFYDLLRLDQDTAAAVIGDVQGHNATAAALMGQIRTAVHVTAKAGASPAEVLTRTNRLLTDLDTGLFASCLYVEVDLRVHRARLASAGHPPPLLRHPDGTPEVPYIPPGLLLGLDPDTRYRSTELPLPPRSVLALYTDGLLEVPGEDLGQAIEAAAAHLARAPEEGPGAYADSLLGYGGGARQRQDDIALLVLQTE
ncbi:SpoIIE family protein phosphatase [Streptomyces sp. NPDC058045]|uniref:SpoIIE family protein phosphatase n=1 Tax=Streptomyces sp. NPDC058045 TaxID=3346311 RepID=UPI0036E20A88